MFLEAFKNGNLESLKAMIHKDPWLIEIKTEQVSPFLHHAVKDGNARTVEFLLENNANPDQLDSNGKIPLYWAIMSKRVDLAQLLLDHLACNVEDNNSQKALILAMLKIRDIGILECLLKARPFLINQTVNGDTALHFAVRLGDLEVIKCLINHEADVDAINNSKMTSLHYAACSKKNIEILKLLILSNANVDVQDDNLWTPLHYACQSGYIEVAKELLKNNANIEAKNIHEQTPLHLSSNSNQFQMVQFLVQNKANLKARDSDGQTALHLAVKYSAVEIVKYLMEIEPSIIESEDGQGLTVIHLAIQQNNSDFLDTIIAKTAKSDRNYWHYLFKIAIDCGNLDIVKFLVHKELKHYGHLMFGMVLSVPFWVPCLIAEYLGIYKPTKSENLKSPHPYPLHYAAEIGNLQMVEFLLKSGYLANCKNDDLKTPFDIALEQNHYEVCFYLKSKMVPNESDKTTDICAICYGPRNGVFVFMPCGHALACEKCCLQILSKGSEERKCPSCRGSLQGCKKIFIL